MRSARRWSVGFEDALDRGPSSERRLCAGGARAPARLRFAADRCSRRVPSTFFPRVPKQSLHGSGSSSSQSTDGGDADLGEPASVAGPTPTSARRAVREGSRVQIWIDDDQSIRLRDRRCQPSPGAGTRYADRDRQAKFGAHAQPEPSWRSLLRTEEMRGPATSAKASSMEIRSTEGVKSLRTLMAASPSRLVSSKCPPTKTRSVQSCRARRPGMPLLYAEGPRS